MKFNFCGELDCPDWLLLEISNISKLSAVKVKLLVNHCIKCIHENEQFDWKKVQSHTSQSEVDANKSVLAALHFIITKASKYDTTGYTLCEELQQLGLPREHSAQIKKSYEDNIDQLKLKLTKDLLINNRLSLDENIIWKLESSNLMKSQCGGSNIVSTRISLSDPDKIPLGPIIKLTIHYKTPTNNLATLDLSLTYLMFINLKSEFKNMLNKIECINSKLQHYN